MQGNPPSTLPRRVGGFHLIRELGRGGMGVVYEAQEIDSGRIVALKVLAAELSVSGEAFERFRREARIAASISDVNCVFVYGAHQIEDSPAIAMELVGGETLQERIARKEPIPIERAVRWILDVIDGLDAAHAAGVIHRDVKPSNCFLATDGHVKIGDFGLSRTLERDIQLTQSGQFLGSPLYASPEQIRGRTLDARSDQYSCAATLYAVLTGRAPFGGSNVGEVLARILSEPATKLRSIRPEIPSELERVVLRAMEREPDKRFRDLDAFRSALLPFSDRTAAAASLPRRLSAWILDGAILAFGASMLATAFQSSSGAHVVETARPWLTMPLHVQILLGLIPIAYFAISEGAFASSIGKWLTGVRIASVGSGPPLWVRAIPRAILYEIVGIGLGVAQHTLPQDRLTFVLGGFVVFFGLFGFRVCTMRKRNGWRGPYELWTGTRVVQAKAPFRRVRRFIGPPEPHVSRDTTFPEKLGEYRVLGLVGATRSGPLLHARDERLERSVWIQFRNSGVAAGEARRSLNTSNRLRWLESLNAADSTADVFESPGGCGISAWTEGEEPLDWPMAERVLSSLADELVRSESDDGAASQSWSLNQVWIDRKWNVRLLDESLPMDDGNLDGLAFLGASARVLLGIGGGREFPPDLPVHAEPLVLALTGHGSPGMSLPELRDALKASQRESTTVERRTRSAQLAISTAILALVSAFALFVTLILLDFFPRAVEMRGLLRELSAGHAAASAAEYLGKQTSAESLKRLGEPSTKDVAALGPGSLTPSGPALNDEGRRLRATILSYETTHGFGAAATANFEGDDLARVAEAQQIAPNPSEEELELARDQLRATREPEFLANLDSTSKFSGPQFAAITIACSAAVWTIFALLSTLIWPGGLSFRLFGLSIRRRNGRRASRWFGIFRVAFFAVPLSLAYAGGCALIFFGMAFGGWILIAAAAAAQIAGIATSILDPTRGPVDRLLRSRIVPR